MIYYFDAFGFLSETEVVGRVTAIAPPEVELGENMAWNFTGHEWVAVSTALPVPLPDDPRIWWMDVGPFKDRLGMDGLAIAASSHGACLAVREMLSGRKFVGLQDPRVSGMLDLLIATNQPTANPMFAGSGPMTEAKRDAILGTRPVEDERHVKGLPV